MKSKSAALLALITCHFSAYAGLATIPNWQVDGTGDMCIRVSNITETPTEITIKLYNSTGSVHTGGSRNSVKGGLNSPFTLNAKESESICINHEGAAKFGFGTIETTRSDNSHTGSIIAHGIYYGIGAGTHFGWTLPVNEGKPF